MSTDLLNRTDAPFDLSFWSMIDETVIKIAQSQLSTRKLIYADGPFGSGMQYVPGKEQMIERLESGVDLSAPPAVPLIQLATRFTLPSRDIEAYRSSGVPMNLESLVLCVLAITAQEDSLLFYGSKSSGLSGLLTNPGVQKMKMKAWDKVGDAVETIIAAVEKLDAAGFHGPYSLGLSVPLYNKLFRRYPETEILEMDHLKSLVTEGIVKSASIKNGGVLLSSNKAFASIILGQDLIAGFEGPSGRDYVFTLSETVALRLNIPSSVCVLDGA